MKTLLALTLLLVSFHVHAQYKFSLSGKLAGGERKMLYFSADVNIPNEQKEKRDSVRMDQDGRFSFSGEIAYAGLYTVFIEGQRPFLSFFLDTLPLSISGNAGSIYQSSVSGNGYSAVAAAFARTDDPLQAIQERSLKLAIAAQKTSDTLAVRRYTGTIDSLNRIRQANVLRYMEDYPTSFLTLRNIETFIGNLVSYETAAQYLEKMPAIFSRHPVYMKLTQQIAGEKFVKPGAVLPDIELPDTTLTNIVNTGTVRVSGKYMLIDFWASWCGPCRANNPALIKIYEKYRNNGFAVAGISLDDDADRWKNAVKEENTGWINLSDLKGFDSKYAVMFNVRAIPAYLLLDASGKLLLRTSEIGDLEEKMKELYR